MIKECAILRQFGDVDSELGSAILREDGGDPNYGQF